MSGILGFCGIEDQQVATGLMAAMLASMREGDGEKVDLYTGRSLQLARLHLDIVDKPPQPLWSADGSVAVVMDGEIFSWHGLRLDKPVTGKEPDFSNVAVLLSAYVEFGDAFVDHINGTFAAAIWDAADRTLRLVSDHLGTHPIYYAHRRDCLVFGSGARAAAQTPSLPRTVNLDAVAELITFEQVYGDKTLFSHVRLLPPGTVLRFHGGELTTSRYIDLQYPESYDLHNEAFYVDGWIQTLRQAVMRQTRGPAPLGVLLTGGLDSRSIVGMLDGSAGSVKTFTFGLPGCDDERSAREISRALHLPHRFLALDPSYLAVYGEKGVRITDGMKSCVHLQLIAPLGEIVKETRVLYKGFLGGTLHGYVVSHDRLAPVREEVWFEEIFETRSRAFQEHELASLYTDEMHHLVRGVPRQSLRRALEQSRSTWWVDKDSYIDLYEEDRRFTALGVQLARSQAVVRTPLADKDLVRFALSVPPGYRVDRDYYKQAIVKSMPRLAKIPYVATGRPVMEDCFRDWRWRTGEQLRWWLRDKGLSFIPTRTFRPYADHATWLRRELRTWVEQILLSPRALERGYFQPAYIHNLVAEHMAGCDHTRRLGVLLTLELWHRQFID